MTFSAKLPEAVIALTPKKTNITKGPLDIACDTHAPGDSKCACINNEIFKHDSAWATAGVGKRAKNPCNMRKPGTWEPKGVVGQTKGAEGYFLVFDSLQSGITACVETYSRFYRDATPEALVARWTNGGGQGAYYNNVKKCYN